MDFDLWRIPKRSSAGLNVVVWPDKPVMTLSNQFLGVSTYAVMLLSFLKLSWLCRQTNNILASLNLLHHMTLDLRDIKQSELPRPIPWNSVESDHGCTFRIYFNNAGDNVTLTLYPYSTQGLNPTNWHELTNIWIRGWIVLSSWWS